MSWAAREAAEEARGESRSGVRLSGEGTAWARAGRQGRGTGAVLLAHAVTFPGDREGEKAELLPSRQGVTGCPRGPRPVPLAEMGDGHASLRKQLLPSISK